jgi:uncharacterized protein YggE
MKPLMLATAPALALLALAASGSAFAQNGDTSSARFAATTLDISGHGEEQVPPDMATIDLGVVSQASTAADATHANAAAMAKVIAALRAGGVEARDILTSNLGLSPQYAYAGNSGPRLTGYQANNQVTVTAEDLSKLGQVVDAVISAGATSVSQIRFGLKAPGSLENLARIMAMKNLQETAAIYADAAGYHIRRLVNVTETASSRPVAPVGVMRMAAATPTTPVETGQITVSVDVTGEFELGH